MSAPSWLQLLAGARRKVQERNVQSQPAQSSPTSQINGQDEWYDASSSEDSSPAKKGQSMSGVGSQPADTFAQESMAKYLPYVPFLLGKELPPCGPQVQVAYENIVNRLRMRWLASHGQEPVSDICRAIKEDISNQKIMQTLGHRSMFKQRKPWRREIVFQYEVRWIDYFIREAEAPEPMTESEITDRAKESCIPKELGLRCHREDVLKMWGAWHEKKRVRSPTVPGLDEESGPTTGSHDALEKNANNEKEVSGTSADSSEITIVQSANASEESIQNELRAGSNEWSQKDQD